MTYSEITKKAADHGFEPIVYLSGEKRGRAVPIVCPKCRGMAMEFINRATSGRVSACTCGYRRWVRKPKATRSETRRTMLNASAQKAAKAEKTAKAERVSKGLCHKCGFRPIGERRRTLCDECGQ